MINCIAIDDEPLALIILEELCKEVPEITLKRTFTKLSSARMYLNEYPIDLIFLDIQMPQQNGIDFYKSLSTDILVVFTTAFPNFAVKGFEVNALDYLLKPIDLDRLKEACLRAENFIDITKQKNIEYISVRSEYALVKIDLVKITYIETMDDYLKIHLIDSKPVITLMSLKKMQEKLPEDLFLRIHRSYIVSVSKVSSILKNSCFIDNKELPIGAKHKRSLIDRMNSN